MRRANPPALKSSRPLSKMETHGLAALIQELNETCPCEVGGYSQGQTCREFWPLDRWWLNPESTLHRSQKKSNELSKPRRDQLAREAMLREEAKVSSEHDGEPRTNGTALGPLKGIIREALANGPLPASEIYLTAGRAGFTNDQIRRVRAGLPDVVARKVDGRWFWFRGPDLPDQEWTTLDLPGPTGTSRDQERQTGPRGTTRDQPGPRKEWVLDSALFASEDRSVA